MNSIPDGTTGDWKDRLKIVLLLQSAERQGLDSSIEMEKLA
jgi:hypothetical protein